MWVLSCMSTKLQLAPVVMSTSRSGPHLLTCSSRKGLMTRSYLSSMGGGSCCVTSCAACWPNSTASAGVADGKWTKTESVCA